MAPTLVQQIWHKLDEVMETAITWQDHGKLPREQVSDKWFSSVDEIKWLTDKIEYVTKTSIGRGLAESLVIMCTPAFETSDQVVALAVKRYQAKLAGEEMPATPGFMGPSQTGDALRLAGGRTVTNTGSPETINPPQPSPGEKATPTPSATPTQIGPDKSKLPKLSDKAIAAIKKGMAAGFDASMFSTMYGITEDQVKEIGSSS